MANLHRPAPPPCPPLIVRCVWPGGGAGRCRQAESTSNMREDVGLWPAGEVEFGTRGQEIETGLGEMLAAFACQPPVEFFAQRAEGTDVRGTEKRRGGNVCASTCRFRWLPVTSKNKPKYVTY